MAIRGELNDVGVFTVKVACNAQAALAARIDPVPLKKPGHMTRLTDF